MSSLFTDAPLFLAFFYGLSSSSTPDTNTLLHDGFSPLDSIFIGCVLALTALMIFVYQTITAPEVPLESTHQAMLTHKFHAQQLAKQLSAAKVKAAMHRIAIEEQDEVIARLTCDISEKDTANEEYLRVVSDTQHQLLVERRLFARRTAQIDRLAGTLSALRADYDNLSAKRDADLSALNIKLARARSSYRKVEADLISTKELLVARDAKISALEALLAELESASIEVLTDHEALQTTYAAALTHHAADLAAVNAHLDDTAQRLTTAQQQLNQQITDNGALLTQLGSARCAVDDAQAQLLDKEAKIVQLTAEVDHAKAKARRARERRAREVADAETTRMELEARATRAEDALKVAKAELVTAEYKNKVCKDDRMIALERELEKNRAAAREKEKTIREKAEAQAEVDALKAKLEDAKDAAATEKICVESRFDALRAQLDAKDEELKALSDERAHIEAIISVVAPTAIDASLTARLQSVLASNTPADSVSDSDTLTWPVDDHRPLLALSRIVAARQRQFDADKIERLQLQVEAYQFSRRLDQYTEDDLLAENGTLRASLDAERAENERILTDMEQLKQGATGTPIGAEEEAAAAPGRESDIEMSPIRMTIPPGFDSPLTGITLDFPDFPPSPSPVRRIASTPSDLNLSFITIPGFEARLSASNLSFSESPLPKRLFTHIPLRDRTNDGG